MRCRIAALGVGATLERGDDHSRRVHSFLDAVGVRVSEPGDGRDLCFL